MNLPKLTFLRFIAGLWAAIIICVALVIVTGCRSGVQDVAASRLDYKHRKPDGTTIDIKLWSPREVEIQGASVSPETGLLVLTNYSAVPNQGALRARVDEVAQQRAMFRDGLEAGRELGAMAVTGWTGRDVRPPGGGSGTDGAGPLSPEALQQIMAVLRGLGIATNGPATNRVATP